MICVHISKGEKGKTIRKRWTSVQIMSTRERQQLQKHHFLLCLIPVQFPFAVTTKMHALLREQRPPLFLSSLLFPSLRTSGM